MAEGKGLIVKSELYDNSTGRPVRWTVADGTQISRGILLKLTDPFTAVAVGAEEAVMCAGVASHDKAADDASTSIAAWTQGRMIGIASGAIEIGNALTPGGANTVMVPALNASGAFIASGAGIVGYSLETAANGDTFVWRLDL